MKVCPSIIFIIGIFMIKNTAGLDENDINITLLNNITVFTKITTINTNSVVTINVFTPLGQNKSKYDFFIIQTHSLKLNTIISNTSDFNYTTSINGTNIGLVQYVKNVAVYKFYLKNQNETVNNTVLIAVVPYNKKAPVPGGCNMEFRTKIAPYQRLMLTDSVITVDAQSASVRGHLCEAQEVHHQMYHYYLPEYDFTHETYFDGILNMITAPDVVLHGTQVSKSGISFLRRLYNNYKGTGSVYTVIASYKDASSVYIPIVSYGCDPVNWEDSCNGPITVISKVLCAVLLFIGWFTCFFGHNFFKTEMFLVGSLVGSYISYLILNVSTPLIERDLIIISLVIGCVFGLIWLLFWWFCGIPIVSTLLTLLVLGSLIASISFYAGLSDLAIVHNDLTYWGFFASITLLTMIILTSFMHNANILATAIVGGYVFIVPLDHYYGMNLKYIFINTIRRVTVADFGQVIIDPPYQWRDGILTLGWGALALVGALYQWRQQRGRAPFPPASTSHRFSQHQPNERTPLLMPTSQPEPSDRQILIHSAPTIA